MRNRVLFAAMLIVSFTAADVVARGGGGGGGPRSGAGGGPGGGFRGPSRGEFRGPEQSEFRSNEFRGGEFRGEGANRADTQRPQVIRPSIDAKNGPSRNDLQHFLNLPSGGAEARGGQAAQHAAASRPNKNANPAARNAQRAQRHNDINRQFANHHGDYRNWFDRGPFRGPWGRWWGYPAWGALAAWTAFGWGEPVGYNYGDNVYYHDGTVYSNGEPVATSEEYAQQAADIAADGSQTDTANADWMPLGVFALSIDGQANGTEPTIFLQLAVSKEGIIAGTYINTTNDTRQSIEGSVDRKTQRTAWTVAGQKWPVFEAGIYNLTEQTAPVLIHFADGQTQQRLLVRVNQPEGGNGATTEPANTQPITLE
jgi:hypothetical protein